METVDFSPSPSPTVGQQRDALQKGHGRAVQWALAGRLDDAPLLEACLRDQRHDMQVEDSRAAWLWQMVQTVNAIQRFRDPLLDALTMLPHVRSAYQLCELASYYAEAGDAAFRNRLYEIVQQRPVPDFDQLGEDEILRLDKAQGFLFAAKVRGNQLIENAWEWDYEQLLHDAFEQLGEATAIRLLENTNDESVRRFHRTWILEQEREAERKQQKLQLQLPPRASAAIQTVGVEEILAEAEKERPSVGSLRGWGMRAPDDELNQVLPALWSAQRPQTIAYFLRIFSNRPLPVFDSRLIEYCRHADNDVRNWAFNALEMNAHPLVRRFAIDNLVQGLSERRIVGLFIRNYAPGDEARILAAVELPEDVDELHWLFMDVINVLECNGEADPSQLALAAYARTPCANCRRDAARLLHSRQMVPHWLAEECRHDSAKICRTLFQETNGA